MAADDIRIPGLASAAEIIVQHAREYAFFLMDREGRIATWSPGAERITGWTADEAVGMDFAAMFTPADAIAGEPRRELDTAWREGNYEDSRWHVRKDGGRFWANGVTMAVREPEAHGFIKVFRDETANRLADEHRVLLLNELNHRINNTLATVQSLVDQTLRAEGVDRAVREGLATRLIALSEAHRTLVEQNWAGADLATIVERALAPYQQEGASRLLAEGPQLRLSPQQAVSMSLVLHELATNAVKYGALSRADGRVHVDWNLSLDKTGARHMTFLWEERGGPAVDPPSRRGFGSRLIERSFGPQSGGQATIEFPPNGVRCAIHLPLTTPAEVPILDVAAAAAS